MASTGIVVGSLFIVGLFVLGVMQTLQPSDDLPRSTLAGAVSAEKQITQEELNACMKGCMRACVTVEGTERDCLVDCNEQCGAT
jgi:hypothetical protein